MDTRYQVFISSTFSDLIDERQAALRAVLELDQMPAGMELFPAGDDSAWQLIRDVIDSSDYYALIVGGRYGSLDSQGIGYTEKEYEYAVSTGKPVIALLHQNPDNLPRGKTETDENAWAKLQQFRLKVEERHTCVYWNSSEELKARLIVSLTSEIKRHPAVGWVRADQVPSGARLEDLLREKERVQELEAQLAERSGPPPGTEDLLQGDDTFKIRVAFTARDAGASWGGFRYTAAIEPTWNEIFAGVAPKLIGEASDSRLRAALKQFFSHITRENYAGDKDIAGKDLVEFAYDEQDVDTCIVQMRALGLVEESRRKRSVRDTDKYWMLTAYGDGQMARLRALRRKPLMPRRTKAKASKTTASDDA